MKPRPDSRSRYWLDFREFHYEGEDMVVGRAHEINPNTPKGIARRLLDLVRRTRLAGDGKNVKDGDGDGGNGGDGDERDGGEAAADGNDKTENGEDDDNDDDDDDDSVGSDSSESRRIILEYNAPDLGKYTPWADIVNLVDPGVRLVGPFDFEDVSDPPPAVLDEETLSGYDEQTRALYGANRAGLCVRDRVPLDRWEELLDALEERDDVIDPPTVASGEENGGEAVTLDFRSGKGRKPSPPKASQKAGQQTSSGGRRRGRPPRPLTFGATPSRPALVLYRDDPRAIPREDVLTAVKRALNGTRSDRSGKREYFVADEIRDAISEALGSMQSDRRSAAAAAGGGNGGRRPASSEGAARAGRKRREVAAVVVDAICDGDGGLAMGAGDDLPVAFSYRVDERDVLGASEEDARIASKSLRVCVSLLPAASNPLCTDTRYHTALDHEVKERKRRRLAKKEEAEQKRRLQQLTGNDEGDDFDDGDCRSVSTVASSFRLDASARSASGSRQRAGPAT